MAITDEGRALDAGSADRLSIIIPVLDEASRLETTLAALQIYRQRGHELLVVDGGSRDGSVTIARKFADRVLMSGPGHALQMNAGAEFASHDILLFLHIDTFLPEGADQLIQAVLQPPQHVWGRFDIRFDSSRLIFRLLETGINWYAALSGIATGTQAIFVSRQFFERVGNYDNLPLLEDVALSRKLRKFGKPLRIDKPVLTSSRRWERDGVLHTLLLAWRLRTAYFFDVPPQ